MGDKAPIIDKDLHVRDIHLVIVEFFDPSNHTFFTEGSSKAFRFRLMAAIAVLAILRFTFLARLPNAFEAIASLFLGYLAVELVIFMVHRFSDHVNKSSIPGIFAFLGILLILILTSGFLL